MRINVYNEELTERVEFRKKTAANTGAEFYGLYFYLHSPEQLHHGAGDDDSSAVILWSDTPEKLLRLLSKAADEIKRRTKLKVAYCRPRNMGNEHAGSSTCKTPAQSSSQANPRPPS